MKKANLYTRLLMLPIMLLLLGALSGCYEAYVGLGYDWDELQPNPEGMVPDSIPLTIHFSDPNYIHFASRGTGAFDNNAADSLIALKWKRARFYLYAVKRQVENPFTHSENYLVEGEKVQVDSIESGFFNWCNSSFFPFYPVHERTTPYQIFGYYVDDAAAGIPQKSPEAINLPVEIDGSQDLLNGYAKFTDSQLEQIAKMPNGNSIRATSYSGYSAAYRVNPVVHFMHQLVRFRFKAYIKEPGGLTKTTRVSAIRVESRYRGLLTIAQQNAEQMGITFYPEKRQFTLHDYDFSSHLVHDYTLQNELHNTPERALLIGESLLLPEATSYTFMVTLIVNGVSQENHYTVSLADGFKKNREYTVRMALYDDLEADISVSLTGWSEGGDIDIDLEPSEVNAVR
ncbi:MAG: hypothetical protein ACRCY5_02140 [Phocaeicola sp.]